MEEIMPFVVLVIEKSFQQIDSCNSKLWLIWKFEKLQQISISEFEPWFMVLIQLMELITSIHFNNTAFSVTAQLWLRGNVHKEQEESRLHRDKTTHHKVTQMSIFLVPGVRLSEPVKSVGVERYL